MMAKIRLFALHFRAQPAVILRRLIPVGSPHRRRNPGAVVWRQSQAAAFRSCSGFLPHRSRFCSGVDGGRRVAEVQLDSAVCGVAPRSSPETDPSTGPWTARGGCTVVRFRTDESDRTLTMTFAYARSGGIRCHATADDQVFVVSCLHTRNWKLEPLPHASQRLATASSEQGRE